MGWPVTVAPKNDPAIQPTASRIPQRNWPAIKNAATGNAHRYQTPWTRVQTAITAVTPARVRHRGGDESPNCQAERMITSPERVSRNGRPNISRGINPEVSVTMVNVINHASGRFNQGSGDHPKRAKSPADAKITSLSVSQWLQRKICRRKKCQTKFWSLNAGPSTRMSPHDLPLTAFAACRKASSSGK